MDDSVHSQSQQSAEAQGQASRDLQHTASSRSSRSHAMPCQPESMTELLQQLGRLVDGIRQPSGQEQAEGMSPAQPQSREELVPAGGTSLVGASVPCPASQRTEPASIEAIDQSKAERPVSTAEDSALTAKQAATPSVSSCCKPPWKSSFAFTVALH